MEHPVRADRTKPDSTADDTAFGSAGGFLGRRPSSSEAAGDNAPMDGTNLDSEDWPEADPGAEMISQAPAAVAEIFKQLVGHRQRVVRQLAGVPAAAMRAAIDQGHNVLERHDPHFDGPERTTFLRWLENKASENFLIDMAFALTPWRKERQKRQWEEAVAKTEAQIALTRLQGEIGDRALTMTQQDTMLLDAQDTAFLNFMVEQSHIPEIPTIVNLYSPGSHQSPSAFWGPGVPGTVIMRGDRKGDYFGELPTARQYPWSEAIDKQFGDFISEYARNLTDGKAPIEITDHHHQIYTRWFILLHEVAHTRFAQIDAPFEPKEHSIGTKPQQAINRWITGPFAVAPKDGNQLLNENHSDALGAMLLMEVSGHDPIAAKAIKRFSYDRVQSRERADIGNHERMSHGSMGSQFDCIHATEWTLQRVMDNIDQWAGKTPQQIRALALSYASDGLMDFVDPKREMINGKQVGHSYSDAIVAPEPCGLAVRSNLLSMAVTHAHGIDPIKQMSGFDLDPAVVKLMKGSWDAIKSQIDELLVQELILDGGPGGTVGEGLRRHTLASLCCMNELLSDPLLPINNHSHRDYQSMVRAYQRDLPLMRQAFGVEPPQMSANSLEQWRNARYGSKDKPGRDVDAPTA